MYKVFINDKVIYFTNNKEFHYQLDNFLVINFYSSELIHIILKTFKGNKGVNNIVILEDDYEAVFLNFKKHFKVIKAAGGWVRNKAGKSLFIYRLDKWDLPKGKIETGESNETGAIREVEEECGINGLKINKQLADTFHIYELDGDVILKQTYWFEMEADFEGELIPQLEENITEAVWFSDDEIKNKVFDNTYASISELIQTNLTT